MAIKVNGTTVIDDSRNLSNVGGLKTVNGNSLVGSGNIEAGASTTYGAVGTYIAAYVPMSGYGVLNNNATKAGSSLRQSTVRYGFNTYGSNTNANISAGVSGTWRHMNSLKSTISISVYVNTLWVRIA